MTRMGCQGRQPEEIAAQEPEYASPWRYPIQGLDTGQVDKARSAPAGPEKGEAA